MDLRRRYLDLLARCLTRYDLGDDQVVPVAGAAGLRGWAQRLALPAGAQVVQVRHLDAAAREVGADLPAHAETMIGLVRLDNLRHCIETVLRDGVPGDLIETGVWRGGACIFMRGVLEAYDVRDRRVWVADSFRGLPPPDAERYPADAGDDHHARSELAVSVEEVQANFRRYDLLDDQVEFLVGWFSETLPAAPMQAIAVARLDGDMYSSTIDALGALWPKVSVGGFVIIDDYGAVEGCRLAVDDFRREHGIVDPLETIDWTGRYWRRSR